MNVDILAKIEVLLFVSKEPVPLKEIVKVVDLSKKEVKDYLKVLHKEYSKKSHGIEIKEYDGRYIFATKPEPGEYVQKLQSITKINRLTQAALETLAIIAYKQPVTRSEIEEIRGVKAEKTLATLSKYELIEELGRKDTIGNPIVYGTTEEFLYHFDLTDLSELPPIEDIQE